MHKENAYKINAKIAASFKGFSPVGGVEFFATIFLHSDDMEPIYAAICNSPLGTGSLDIIYKGADDRISRVSPSDCVVVVPGGIGMIGEATRRRCVEAGITFGGSAN